jgi:low affinity Fe/Cu permease
MGSSWAFLISCILTLVWAASGPAFHFSDTWQLVANTSTTIITFLMIFLVQATQNRDARAMHVKMDELIRSIGAAQNRLIGLEEQTDDEVEAAAQAVREEGSGG